MVHKKQNALALTGDQRVEVVKRMAIVLARSESLALDSERDRAELLQRLARELP